MRDLLGQARGVLVAALGEGGTSFDALYVDVNGQSGYFDRSLHAYGQEGRACDRCGTPIRRVAFMNRSSYFCPVCQPVPRARRHLQPSTTWRTSGLTAAAGFETARLARQLLIGLSLASSRVRALRIDRSGPECHS